MYATEVDLKTRFGAQVIDDLKLGREGEADPVDIVQVALQDAEEEINGYIGSRYLLPLANVPSNLKRIACDIARYRLYTEDPLEHITKLYDDAIAFLKRVQDKKADLQIIDEQSKEIIDDAPKKKPSTMPIGTTYTGGVFGDAVLNMMPSIK
ncbi:MULTISPECIES: gp436 family protein [Acinetobacter]|jgi:phage gp36-like protein|uniref:DUF1320 domain-containing protein n=1 Tax=Acinetobacter chengduensis TaxID=2420890 RepID=A0ABX9TR21_9GAMM|nr:MULTISPECIES: DUF1320 domain-containing protein [Acinetobacter]RKG37506.1 DUF1320 domain-containing protein [Acinetobacter sp. WCHAc060007]RLL16973.1 DUF1320 domain-containing protein [Acinetobacter chengduensis]